MCGIVGYTGFRDAYDVVINGLRRLEYRGYDSAGIAVIGAENVIKIFPRRLHNIKRAVLQPFFSVKLCGGL